MKERVVFLSFLLILVSVIGGCSYGNVKNLNANSKIEFFIEKNEMIVKSVPEPIITEGISNLYTVAVSDGGRYYIGITTLSDLKVNEIVVWKEVRFVYDSLAYKGQSSFFIVRSPATLAENENKL